MLNYVWAIMIIIGVVYAGITGNMQEVTDGALDSAAEGVSLCISMAGIVAFWMGSMEIAKRAGLIDKLTSLLKPLLVFLFPKIPKNHESLEYIATNIVANILGLGWACTPAGLKAMEALAKLEKERNGNKPITRASAEMCTFLVLNISSLQLVPVNMIAYRSKYGSTNPAGIIFPAMIATFFSTMIAVVYCKIKERSYGK